ncbi:DUF3833 family protein [Notoacmeibacter ruber]|nr:DUF3833 family protein [Notoacmeibacter ruber]
MRIVQFLSATCLLLTLLALPASAADRPFDLFSFFDGTARSEGIIEPLIGDTKDFTARFQGEADGTRLRLVETFDFPEGRFEQIWKLRREGNRLSGTVRTEGEDGTLAEPVPVRGELLPGGAVLSYDGYAPGGSETRFGFTHRMTAQENGAVENRVTITKFLLPVARSIVTFHPAGS